MDGNASVQGDSARAVRSRHGIHVPSATRHAATESSRPCFARERRQRRWRRAPGVASGRFFHGRTAAQRLMGKWARLELELACAAIPACATSSASQGPRHGSVPGRGSNWISHILVPLATCAWRPLEPAKLGPRARIADEELEQGSSVCRALCLFMTLPRGRAWARCAVVGVRVCQGVDVQQYFLLPPQYIDTAS